MISFEIAGRRIGEGAPVFIVAELSANHGGDLQRALRTIEAAARAGADAIKVQTYTPDTLTLNSSAAPFVVKTNNEWAGRTLHDLYAEAMTPWEWHPQMKQAAEAAGLAFFSTPFDPTAVEFLEQLDVPAHKIASFEIADLPLVEFTASRGKPMIISTGMASLEEIEAALKACRSLGNDRVALLRCVSAYPAKPDAMNLQSIATLRSFGVVVGLSDHTRNATVAIASVALGAKVIEKHFILNRSDGGPDAFFSLEPAEFRQMVDAVRATERAMGPPRFGPSEDERASVAFRRSLFVARDVRAGQVLTCDDIRSVRPSNGIPPRHLPEILGRCAAVALGAGTPLSWDHVTARPPATVKLRPATLDDSSALLEWRNDALTRDMSVSHAEVPLNEHAAWLRRVIASDNVALFIAEDQGQRVGQVRLEEVAGPGRSVELSLTVAPQARGRGLGTTLLLAAEEFARGRGADRILARIRAGNDRSIRAFKRAGYYSFVQRTTAHGRFLLCERRLVSYG